MTKICFNKRAFSFFENLAENNNREWFNAHKDEFKSDVDTPFLELLEALSAQLADAKISFRGGPKTKFKMNRDVRFSNDKSPYKTAISALLTPSGTKDEMGGVLYVHMDRAGGLAAAGWYKLSPKMLKPMRQKMISDADEFDRVRAALSASGRTLSDHDTLSSMPRGFEAHSDHRHAEFVRLKSLILSENLPKSAFTSGDVIDRLEKLANDAMPLLRFFKSA
ncbi:MAG: TIGR02453 family protein [Pseudomonadota bacterium]